MKQYTKFLILIFVFMFIFKMPQVFAKESITLESVELIETSEKAIEKSSPTINGLKISFDLSFTDISDYAKYKVVISNSTEEDYEIKNENEFNSSNYITYNYEFDGDSNVVKTNSKLTMYVTITYKNEVPEDKKIDNKYVENNAMTINLVNNSNKLTNPSTNNNMLIVICTILISLILIVVLQKRISNKKILSIIIFILTLLPTITYAIEKLQVDLTTKVTIEEKHYVTYVIWDSIKITDKSKYDIYDISKMSKNESSCTSVPNNNEYEQCAIVYAKELYATGDEITLKDKYTYHAFDTDGNLVEQTVATDGTLQNNIWGYYIGSQSYKKYNIKYWWFYSKNINAYEDIEKINFTNIQSNNWTFSYYPGLKVNSPCTFTMPDHDMTFTRVLNWQYVG